MTYRYQIRWTCDGCGTEYDIDRPVDSIGPFPPHWVRIEYHGRELHFHDKTCLILHWEIVVVPENDNVLADSGKHRTLGDAHPSSSPSSDSVGTP